MFRHRDLNSWQGLISTGDTVSLSQVPFHQLQQSLCCSLAYIQRCEDQASRYLALTSALRGSGGAYAPKRVPRFTKCPKIRHRYDPASFHAYVDDGSRVLVSEMTTEQLLACNARAMVVCERSIGEGDGFRWWDQSPAVTVGPKLKAFMEHAKTFPPTTEIESNWIYTRFRRLDKKLKELLAVEMGVYDDVPEFAGTELALHHIPFSVDGVCLKAAIGEVMDRLAPESRRRS